MTNKDGSNDLITVLAICHSKVNKTLILSILKKIMDQYVIFKSEVENNDDRSLAKVKSSEFKLSMNKIIKLEEMNFEANHSAYSYGSTEENLNDEHPTRDVIKPNDLVLASEDVKEVRQIMLDNINKLLDRGDKINVLVDQTDRLANSSLIFQKKAQLIRKKMWLDLTKFITGIVISAVMLTYLIIGYFCSFPFYSHCIHH